MVKWQNEKKESIIPTMKDIDWEKLLGVASHKIKGPLASMKAIVLLDSRKVKDVKLKEDLLKIEERIDKSNKAADELFALLSLKMLRPQFSYEVFDFDKFVVDLISNNKLEERVEVTGETEKEVIHDREKLEEIILSVIRKELIVSKKISINMKSDKKIITVRIKINGNKIDGREENNMFKLNSGLDDDPLDVSLYMATEIIKKQGGRVWIKMDDGKLTNFLFNLPIKAKHPQV